MNILLNDTLDLSSCGWRAFSLEKGVFNEQRKDYRHLKNQQSEKNTNHSTELENEMKKEG